MVTARWFAVAMVVILCACDGMGPAEVDVFVMESIFGEPPDSDTPWPGCPRILTGRLEFEGLADRRGRVRIEHTIVRQRTPGEAAMDTVSLTETTTFARADSTVIVAPGTWWRSTFEFIDGGGALRTHDARCYPGQTGFTPDLAYLLIYRRANSGS